MKLRKPVGREKEIIGEEREDYLKEIIRIRCIQQKVRQYDNNKI